MLTCCGGAELTDIQMDKGLALVDIIQQLHGCAPSHRHPVVHVSTRNDNLRFAFYL